MPDPTGPPAAEAPSPRGWQILAVLMGVALLLSGGGIGLCSLIAMAAAPGLWEIAVPLLVVAVVLLLTGAMLVRRRSHQLVGIVLIVIGLCAVLYGFSMFGRSTAIGIGALVAGALLALAGSRAVSR